LFILANGFVAPRPLIFISAVSKEQKSARQLVSNTLQFLGYEPVWQDIFGTEQGDLREMLRRKIDECKGIVQLVGKCYGAEPPKPDETFGRVSYTQYEALYAKLRGKKVWYLFLDENFPGDAHQEEPSELRELQETYRRRLKSESQLYHPLNTREGLESSVLKLRDDLTRLRRGVKQWAAAVIILLVAITAAVLWLEHGQQQERRQIVEQNQELAQVNQKLTELLQSYPGTHAQIHEEQPNATAAEVDRQTYETLAEKSGVNPATLQAQLPERAQQIQMAADATPFQKASAAFMTRDYAQAERLALAAAGQAQQSLPPDVSAAIKGFQLAGYAADARTNDVASKYDDALSHYRAAQQLVDRASDPLQWAGLQRDIAFVLDEQGQYPAAEQSYRDALKEIQSVRPDGDKDLLALGNNLAITLFEQGKYAEAEVELRQVVAAANKSLDPNDPVLLLSHINLANVLLDQGEYPEAETECADVIKTETEAFGPANGYTLASRNNLAIVLLGEGKYDNAEKELQDLTALESTTLGPEHRYTLATRDTLALALLGGGKFVEAEEESRAVVTLREKVLGLNHPDTINSRNNLAHALNEEGKYTEAESLSREIIDLDSDTLGMKHPYRIESHHNLAVALAGEGRYDEAETEFWETINLRESVLGRLHPDTFSTYYQFALCLKAEGKPEEARKFAQQAVDGANKILGPTHPDTQKYQKLLTGLP
jgi:hypothetical protein